MKVGLLTTSFPRFAGDYRGIFVKRLVDGLVERGIAVDVIEPRGYDVLKRGAGLVPNLKTSFVARLVFPLYCVHFLVIAAVGALRCDLLHANWSLSGFFAVIAGKLAGRKIVLTERSSLLIESRNRWVNTFIGWVMRRSDERVTISDLARRRLEEKFPDLEFRVISNGVDEDMFRPHGENPQRDPREGQTTGILAVGRVTVSKRLGVLLDAAGQLIEKGFGLQVAIVGDGEALESLQAQAAKSPVLTGHVRFPGRKSPEEVAKLMRESDVLVLCSDRESGGNVILEAMSSGLALVSTPVGWAADYITDGENGFIVPVGDADALAAKLELIIENPALRRELGARARQTVMERGLTWRGCAERYQACYERILSRGVKR